MKKLSILCFSFLLIFFYVFILDVNASSVEQNETETIEQTKNETIKNKSMLETPTDISVRQLKKQTTATLTWNKVKSATGYQIYRSTKADSGYKRIKTVGKVSSYKDKKIKDGTIYYYKIRSIKKGKSKVKSKFADPVVLCIKLAKPEVIPKLKNMGYQLVTVSELARYRGYKMKNGTVYSSFPKR